MFHRSLFVVLLLVIGVLPGSAIVTAQDDAAILPVLVTNTPDAMETTAPIEPTVAPIVIDTAYSNTEALVNAVLLAMVVLLGLAGGFIVTLARASYNSAPRWFTEMLRDNFRQGMDQVDKFVEITQNETDDILAKRVRAIVEELWLKLGEQPPGAVG